MSTPTHLYLYQCGACRSTASIPVMDRSTRIDCPLCHRWMRYLWSERITTDQQRALAARGLVFQPYHAAPRIGFCGTCRKQCERAAMINLSPAGRFCSQACADEGVRVHEAYMQREADEEAALQRKLQPWKHKETA